MSPSQTSQSQLSQSLDANRSTGQVRRYYQLVDAGEVDELVALFASDAVYRRPGYEPLVGRGELTHFYSSQRVIKDGRHTIQTVVTQDARVAVHGQFQGTLKDGTQVAVRFADFFTLTADALFAERDTFFFAPMI